MPDSSVNSIFEELFARYSALGTCRRDIRTAYETLRGCFAGGGKLLLCGNGGSAADCGHIAGELMKGFLLKRPLSPEKSAAFSVIENNDEMRRVLAAELQGSLRAVNLCEQTALNTAIANDMRPALVYAQQVTALGDPGDVLLGISTSGNAENVCYAMLAAQAAGMRRIGLTGADGGRLAPLCDVAIRVPATRTHEAQEYHLPVYHALCAMLEAAFFEK